MEQFKLTLFRKILFPAITGVIRHPAYNVSIFTKIFLPSIPSKILQPTCTAKLQTNHILNIFMSEPLLVFSTKETVFISPLQTKVGKFEDIEFGFCKGLG